LAEETGIEERRILTWVNLADLMRLTGVGKQFAELLEAAGVDSVKELRHRNAENLAQAMAETNAKKKLTRAVPSATQIQGEMFTGLLGPAHGLPRGRSCRSVAGMRWSWQRRSAPRAAG